MHRQLGGRMGGAEGGAGGAGGAGGPHSHPWRNKLFNP